MKSTAPLTFHHFHGGKHPSLQGSFGAKEFRQLLSRENIISAEVWLAKHRKGVLKPGERCLSFDDGLKSQYEIAIPILKSLNLRAFFFVYTSIFEPGSAGLESYRYFINTCFPSVEAFYEVFFGHEEVVEWVSKMSFPKDYLKEFPFYSVADRRFRFTRDQVLGPRNYHRVMNELMKERSVVPDTFRETACLTPSMTQNLVAEGHILGLHSHTHPTDLASLSEADQFSEYEINYHCLWELTGEKPFSMAHPCDSFNTSTLRVLKKLDIQLGFRAGPDGGTENPLSLPRWDVNHYLKSE